jgi:hypothetical protein
MKPVLQTDEPSYDPQDSGDMGYLPLNPILAEYKHLGTFDNLPTEREAFEGLDHWAVTGRRVVAGARAFLHIVEVMGEWDTRDGQSGPSVEDVVGLAVEAAGLEYDELETLIAFFSRVSLTCAKQEGMKHGQAALWGSLRMMAHAHMNQNSPQPTLPSLESVGTEAPTESTAATSESEARV